MMGLPCLRLEGEFFACCDVRTGGLVVKLTEARVSVLLDACRVQPFAPNGRRFRAWAIVSTENQHSCVAYLDEALQEAARRRKQRPQSRGVPGRLVEDQKALASRSLIHLSSIHPTPVSSNGLQTTRPPLEQKRCYATRDGSYPGPHAVYAHF